MTISFPTQANPFTCDADTLSALLVSLLDEVPPIDCKNVVHGYQRDLLLESIAWPRISASASRGYAVGLVGMVAPVLAWVRDHKGVRIDLQQSHFAMELPNLWTLALHKVFRARASVTRIVAAIPVPEMPDALTEPVWSTFDLLPGYRGSVFFEQPASHRSAEIHNSVLLEFAHAFACGGSAIDRSDNVPPAWKRQS